MSPVPYAYCLVLDLSRSQFVNWLWVVQLKIPFTKAFSRNKKLKPMNSTSSDVDSDTASLYSDASLAQSAQAQLSTAAGTRSVPTTPIKCSRSDVM